MKEIAKLNKGERYYHLMGSQLEQFANWSPEYEEE